MNIHNNLDGSVTQGTEANPQMLGFSEPFFNRAANTGRSPAGTINFSVRDHVSHQFSGSATFVWVVLIVLDDDNSRGYPSEYFHDGSDMEFIVLDLS